MNPADLTLIGRHIRLEPLGRADKTNLIGQVLDTANPGVAFTQLPVALMGSGKPLAASATSEFGEFHLECRLEGACYLRLRLPDGRALDLPLTGYLAGQVERGVDLIEAKEFRKHGLGTRKSTKKST